ncbi:MAG TPA: NAD(P)/FAD-dependent oxidoreductase [Alphaproteobacteria bacterium]
MGNGAQQSKAPAIAIMGCGFAGIGLAIALKKAGIDGFTIYERASEPGGVWRDNHYPGAACDVPSRLYAYSFEPEYPWSAPYAPQPDILAYIRHCVAEYALAPHIRFDTNVAQAAFDEGSRRWRLETADGVRFDADILVSAVGLFNRPTYPDLAGRARFAGAQFHSADWHYDFDFAGKSVAVIGTGASAVQFVPEIAKIVERLYLFQRTPQYVLPRLARNTDMEAGSPLAHRIERLRIFWEFEWGTRRRRSAKLTAEGQQAFLGYLEAQVADPVLRAKLTPDYRLGCKRVLFSNDWYPTLRRANVEVVDSPIDALTERGVRTGDGRERRVDAVIYGTGFAPANFLSGLRIAGLGGRDLAHAWRGGAEAYLGIAVSGFPNFFMMYGPNTNTAVSIIFMLESQARYIVSAIRRLARSGGAMNLRADVQHRFNAEVQRRIGRTVVADANCDTYFRAPSGKITTQWPGHLLEYKFRTSRVRARDYEFA